MPAPQHYPSSSPYALPPPPPYVAPTAADPAASDDEVKTMFVAGLLDDVKVRKIYNLFREFPGYHSSQLRSQFTRGLGPYSTSIKKAEKEIKEMAKKVNNLCGSSILLYSAIENLSWTGFQLQTWKILLRKRHLMHIKQHGNYWKCRWYPSSRRFWL